MNLKMKTETIINKIQKIRAGQFFRIRYISKMRVKAEYEKQGITIFKVVDTTTRTGVSYKSLIDKHNMIEHPAEGKSNNWTWTVKNRIKHNSNTGKDYLVVAPISKGNNTKTYYIFVDDGGCVTINHKEVIEEYIIKSYWNEDKPKPTIMNISLENVLLVK